jgi:hypothetical protein
MADREQTQTSELIKQAPKTVDYPDIIMDIQSAKNIIDARYGTKFIYVDDLKITYKQVARKVKHAEDFGISLSTYNLTKTKAKEISDYTTDGMIGYVQRGNPLPSDDLIKQFLINLKSFCQSNQVVRSDTTRFQGKPSITFSNSNTQQVAIFSQTKKFITAYKLTENQWIRFKFEGEIGKSETYDISELDDFLT